MIRTFGLTFNLLLFLLFLAGLIGASGCSRKRDSPSVAGVGWFTTKCARCQRENNDMRAPQPQKSGWIHALDPASRGRLLWKSRIAHGGPLGGIQWGGAADSRYAYFPVSDYDDSNPLVGGGLFALDLWTGKRAWYAPPPKPACAGAFGCSAAQMAPGQRQSPA